MLSVNRQFNAFNIEASRSKLAKEKRYKKLLTTYASSFPEIKDQNTSKLWDRLNTEGSFYKEKSPMAIDRISIVSSLIKGGGVKVLDAGFGRGTLEELVFKKKKRNNLEWHGIDISSASVYAASKRFNNAKFKIGDITKIPYEKNLFDYVVALEVLEHISPHMNIKVFKEIHRVLKKNGKIIVSVPLNENLEDMIKEGKNYNAHVRMYTPQLIKAELEMNNFKVIKIKTLYAFPNNYYIKTFICKYLVPNFRNQNNIILLAEKI